MIREIYEFRYNKNLEQKRGYHIIGKKWSFIFFTVIGLMIADTIAFMINARLVYIIGLLLLSIGLFLVIKKIDSLMLSHEIEARPKEKESMFEFLTKERNINHSSQIKELAIQMELAGSKSRKSFNLIPFLNLVLPVVILLSTFIYQDYEGDLTLIVALFSMFFVLSFGLHVFLNAFAEIFINTKADRQLYLASLLNEVYLDWLIFENKNKKQQLVQNYTFIYNTLTQF